MTRTFKQQGVTSIFVVIFAALLFSVITLSFTGLMARDQRRASDDELSQSAYDSALAGVEDAKRVIMAARSGNAAATNAINDGTCRTVQSAGLASGDEVVIQSTSSGAGSSLNQAYTCVKISLDSPDYELNLDRMKSEIVPLRAAGSFNRIKLEWHQPPSGVGASVTAPCGAASLTASNPDVLCPEASWGASETTPALLRAQTITPGSSVTLDELNQPPAGNTVFLYPVGPGAAEIALNSLERFVDDYDMPATTGNYARGVECAVTPLSTYTCSVELVLEDTVPVNSQLALLRLTALYNASDVRVSLYNGTTKVNFRGVQPTVDSTGRANDLFRRVEARLSLASEVAYPEAALDVAGPICKDFYVTPIAGQANWIDATHCQP